MARKGKPSRSQRNQAKWAAHAATHKTATAPTKSTTPVKVDSDKPTVPSYAGGTKPRLITGSVQGAPHKVTVTQRKGIKLQPFADYIPRVPADYGTGLDARRDGMEFESAGKLKRTTLETRTMQADSASGGETMQSYGERLPEDIAAGVYRDGVGRIMRLTTNLDGPLRPSGVKAVVSREDAAIVRSRAAAEAKQAARDEKQAARDAKKLMREQEAADRAQRRLDRMAGRGENSVDRAEMDQAARAVCAAHGITDPTRKQIAAARDMITAQKQVQAYTNGHALAA